MLPCLIGMVLAVASCVAVPCAYASDAQGVDKQIVRVGYFQFDGYHMIDDEGNYSGYGYELLEDMARYNNWDLQYVGYDKSWSDMQQMLSDGEIDILTSAQKTPQREAAFAFSTEDVGTSSALLTVRAGSTKYEADRYETYNGMRVGVLAGNSRNQSLAEFAQEKGFGYTTVSYASNDDLAEALQQGTDIDAALTSSLRSTQNEWLLDEFDESPFYVMTQKDDTALMAQVNKAIVAMDADDPEWRARLEKKYYTSSNGTELDLTSDERQFLQQCSDDGIVFKVLVDPDCKPYSYIENGQPKGILVTIFQEMARRAGISYRYLNVASSSDYDAAISSGEADIVIDNIGSISAARQAGYQLTDSYLSIQIARLTKRNPQTTTATVCTTAAMAASLGGSSNLLADGSSFVTKGSTKECVDAVLDGSVDAAYLYAYTARLYSRNDELNRLTFLLMPQESVDMSLAVSDSLDSRLLTSLDKAAHSLDDGYATSVQVSQSESGMSESRSIIGLIYDNPVAALVIVGVFALLVAAILLFAMRARHADQDERRQAELERFVSYVCDMNDLVLDINAHSGACLRYAIDEGGVKTIPLSSAPVDEAFLRSVVFPDDVERVLNVSSLDAMRRLADDGGEVHFECRVRIGETYRWYLFVERGIPHDEEHPCNIVVFARDIDDIKTEQETHRAALSDALIAAEHASKAKGDFLSRISHEIRTPLNAIMGFLTLARLPETDSQEIEHCITSAQAASQHLLSIINDVLDISSIEAGRLQIARDPFAIRQVIDENEALFRSQAVDKGITFIVDADGIGDCVVVGDKLRLNQVLANLLSNAMKFTPSGGTVRLAGRIVGASDAKKAHVVFEVSDSGIGMSEEYVSRIFTPFEQESAHVAQAYGGTGLGLSITKNLLELMGGSIDVASKKDEGTTFTVSLAFDRCAHGADQAHREAEDAPSAERPLPDYAGAHVLVVEDNPINLEIALAMLQLFNVSIDAASDGTEAVELFETAPPGTYQLIFMDVQMPKMNGYEATRAIRSDPRAGAKTVPIVAMTANAFSEDISEALASGMNGHMAKPVSIPAFSEVLAEYLGTPS